MWSILYYLRNDPNVLRRNLEVRGLSTSIIDEALDLDIKVRSMRKSLDELRHRRNVITKEIPRVSGDERRRLVDEAKKLSREIDSLDKEYKYMSKRLDEILLSLPNILHPDVPKGVDERDNKPIRYWGRPKVMERFLDQFLEMVRGFDVEYTLIDYEIKGHADYGDESHLTDVSRASKVSGSRFYYMLGDLIYLQIALVSYALDKLVNKGFIPVYPPLLMKREAYIGVTSLSDFEDAIYKVEGENLYLIATSEHPMAAMYMNEVIETDELPIKLVGISSCFRKEAGAHGKDTKGIFRVHNFDKVEQFIFSHPDESWELHEEIIRNAEEIFQGLGIPYRIVDICTGDIGGVAARKYDLEAWMPAQGRYREMVSASNCTDWQSYRLNIRFAKKRGYPSEGYVHTLNSTGLAVQRTITAIIENFQERDGRVRIPAVLRRYLSVFDDAPKDHLRPVDLP
jgi:seryl-tRNA synthetase